MTSVNNSTTPTFDEMVASLRGLNDQQFLESLGKADSDVAAVFLRRVAIIAARIQDGRDMQIAREALGHRYFLYERFAKGAAVPELAVFSFDLSLLQQVAYLPPDDQRRAAAGALYDLVRVNPKTGRLETFQKAVAHMEVSEARQVFRANRIQTAREQREVLEKRWAEDMAKEIPRTIEGHEVDFATKQVFVTVGKAKVALPFDHLERINREIKATERRLKKRPVPLKT